MAKNKFEWSIDDIIIIKKNGDDKKPKEDEVYEHASKEKTLKPKTK